MPVRNPPPRRYGARGRALITQRYGQATLVSLKEHLKELADFFNSSINEATNNGGEVEDTPFKELIILKKKKYEEIQCQVGIDKSIQLALGEEKVALQDRINSLLDAKGPEVKAAKEESAKLERELQGVNWELERVKTDFTACSKELTDVRSELEKLQAELENMKKEQPGEGEIKMEIDSRPSSPLIIVKENSNDHTRRIDITNSSSPAASSRITNSKKRRLSPSFSGPSPDEQILATSIEALITSTQTFPRSLYIIFPKNSIRPLLEDFLLKVCCGPLDQAYWPPGKTHGFITFVFPTHAEQFLRFVNTDKSYLPHMTIMLSRSAIQPIDPKVAEAVVKYGVTRLLLITEVKRTVPFELLIKVGGEKCLPFVRVVADDRVTGRFSVLVEWVCVKSAIEGRRRLGMCKELAGCGFYWQKEMTDLPVEAAKLLNGRGREGEGWSYE
ncbi:hypothetical protein RUND412_005748 [Rhizina undulata]